MQLSKDLKLMISDKFIGQIIQILDNEFPELSDPEHEQMAFDILPELKFNNELQNKLNACAEDFISSYQLSNDEIMGIVNNQYK